MFAVVMNNPTIVLVCVNRFCKVSLSIIVLRHGDGVHMFIFLNV